MTDVVIHMDIVSFPVGETIYSIVYHGLSSKSMPHTIGYGGETCTYLTTDTKTGKISEVSSIASHLYGANGEILPSIIEDMRINDATIIDWIVDKFYPLYRGYPLHLGSEQYTKYKYPNSF